MQHYKKVKAIQDKNGDWFVIPEQLLPFYYIDCEDDALIDTGQFDNKWGKYLTGGGFKPRAIMGRDLIYKLINEPKDTQ